MSDDLHRRRRISPTGPRRSSGGGGNFTSWIVTVIAAIVVIVGGWFLGQALAHWLSPGSRQTAQAPSPTPVVSPAASPTENVAQTTPSSPSAAPATTAPSPTAPPPTKAPPTAAPTRAPTVAPAIAHTTVPAASPVVAPTAAPTPGTRTILPVARRPESTSANASGVPAPAAGEGTVRAYIDALRRGDPQAAAAYLGNGSPDEDFIDANTRITSINSAPNSDGSYKVSVDMQTSKGEYYETFTVSGAGTDARILDKTAIKPR